MGRSPSRYLNQLFRSTFSSYICNKPKPDQNKILQQGLLVLIYLALENSLWLRPAQKKNRPEKILFIATTM